MSFRAAALLFFAALLGAAAPPKPTPNAPPEAGGGRNPLPAVREGRGPVPEAVGDDPGTRDFLRAVDWGVLEGVIVQDAGRRKPLDAFARESLWKILNTQAYRGQPPAFTLLSMGFDPAWGRMRVLKLGHPELMQAFGRKKVSLEDLGSEVYERLWNSVDRAGGAKSLRDRAILDLDRRGLLLRDVLGALRVLPGKEGSAWLAMGDPASSSDGVAAFNAFVEMEGAYLRRDPVAFNRAASAWAEACRVASSKDYEEASGRIRLERLYYRFQPFRWGCLGYLAAFLGFLGAWVLARPALGRGALGLLAFSFLVHGVGIATRVAIAGRPPVSNMYEVILYVSWAVVGAAFAVEAVMRLGVAWLPASGMAVLGLTAPALFPFIEGVIHSPMPLDPGISQVQAVLKSNYWLTVHVCTITTSYAILFLGFATGIYYLVSRNESADRVAYRVNQLGFLFLMAGIMTGAWWANASWGRYWGWDPKETGSFITWCLYGAYLHLRLFGFLKPRGAAWLSVAGFAAVLFTMIGVGYFLPGLHSYA